MKKSISSLHLLSPMFLFLISGGFFSSYSVNAPYIIEATPKGDVIVISLRNNDISTEKILILRRTGKTVFEIVDSVPGDSTDYTDKVISPGVEYSYAAIAVSKRVFSDTSNVVSVRAGIFLRVPTITVFWHPDKTIDSIVFYDNSTIENSYELYRKENNGPYSLIGAITQKSSSDTGWRFFIDTKVSPNNFYQYKLKIFNDSLYEYSNEASIYTFKGVPYKYSASKTAEFPIKFAGWSEKVGDSVYVLEKAPDSSDVIAVINVENVGEPLFRGYLKPDSIPDVLKNTVVGFHCRFQMDNNSLQSRQYYSDERYFFFFKVLELYNSSYSLFRADALLKYDRTADKITDTIIFDGMPANLSSKKIILGRIDDSLLLVYRYYYKDLFEYAEKLYVCKFTPFIFDTMCSINLPVASFFSGFFDKRAYFFSYTCHPTCNGSQQEYFHVYDFSKEKFNPIHIMLKTPSFSENSGCMIDSFVAVRLNSSTYDMPLYFGFYDIRNPASEIIYAYTDNKFVNQSVKDLIIDPENNLLFIFGTKSFAIYRYERKPINSKTKTSSLSYYLHPSHFLKIHNYHNNVHIFIDNSSEQINELYISDIKGRLIKKYSASQCKAAPIIIWDKRDYYGKIVAPGSYFVILKHSKITKRGKVILTE